MLVQSGPVYFSGKRSALGPDPTIRPNIQKMGEAVSSLGAARTAQGAEKAGKKLIRNWIGAGLKLLGQGVSDLVTGWFKR